VFLRPYKGKGLRGDRHVSSGMQEPKHVDNGNIQSHTGTDSFGSVAIKQGG